MSNKVIYNVTIKINEDIHQEWLQWMKNIHIPDVMNTGCFESFKVTKIVEDPDDQGIGFAIQYVAYSILTLEKYMATFAKKLQEEHSQRYAGQYVAFRTVLEVLQEG